MKFIKWHIRINKKRKNKKGKHPAIVFAESDDGLFYYNLGLTHSRKRGHHSNLEIKDPSDWSKASFIRDDLSIDEKIFLQEIMNDYKLHPSDYKKIWERIIKRKIKK